MDWIQPLMQVGGSLLGGLMGGKKQTSGGTETYDITDTTRGATAIGKGTAESRAGQSEILGRLMAQMQSTPYSREAAIADSEGVAAQAQQSVLADVGKILKNQSGAGAYSSTESKRQIQDTATRAENARAAVTLDTIAKYGQLQQQTQAQQIQGILGVLGQIQDQSTLQEVDQSTTKKGTVSKDGSTSGSGGDPLAGQWGNIGTLLSKAFTQFGGGSGTSSQAGGSGMKANSGVWGD